MISKHISFAEGIRSETATGCKIDNIPNKEVLQNMELVAKKVFEPMRIHFNTPIYISSFYRCEELNTIIGGSKTSAHCKGQAIDVDAQVYGIKVTNKDIFNFIKENLEFDQLIGEFEKNNDFSWVHLSYKKGNNRNEALVSNNGYGGITYRLINK